MKWLIVVGLLGRVRVGVMALARGAVLTAGIAAGGVVAGVLLVAALKLFGL